MKLEFHAGFFKKLDFLKIEFQNRNMSLNSFRQGAFYWKVSAKEVFCHFDPSTIMFFFFLGEIF